MLIDRRNETWQEAQSVFEKIVTIFPAKIKEVFLVYQYTSGEFNFQVYKHFHIVVFQKLPCLDWVILLMITFWILISIMYLM